MKSTRSHQTYLAVLLSMIMIAAPVMAQGPPGALVNGQCLNGQRLDGRNECMIKLDATPNVSIDPGANGVVMGGNATVAGDLAVTGATTLTGSTVVGGSLTVSGSALLAAGTIGSAELSTNLKKGYIPLGIFNTRIIGSDVFADTIEGATPDGNTNPALQRINSATDKGARLTWPAGNAAEIQFPSFAYPPDLDDTAPLTIYFTGSVVTTDIPVLTISYWEGVGDTNAGSATAAMATGSALQTLSVTIAAGDVGAYPKFATVGLTPGTHAFDVLSVYAAWIEYTRKD